MPERAPVAYPGVGTNHINFSLPLRLAQHRSTSSLSHRSCASAQSSPTLLEVPHSGRERAASVPSSPAYTLDPSANPPNPLTYLHPSDAKSNRRPKPQLRLDGHPRIRADSASSLEASLVELEQLIDVLGTPAPYIQNFFEYQPGRKMELGSKPASPAGLPQVVPEQARRPFNQAGPRWI